MSKVTRSGLIDKTSSLISVDGSWKSIVLLDNVHTLSFDGTTGKTNEESNDSFKIVMRDLGSV